MTKDGGPRPGRLRGLGLLAAEATLGVTELVEAVHRTVAEARGPVGEPSPGRTAGIAGVVYSGVRGVTRLVGSGVDGALAALAPLLGETAPSPRREALVAALNGVLGDHLEASGNPLAIRMVLRRHGQDLPSDPAELARLLPAAPDRVVLMVHGLCMNDAGWTREGHDHGAALERDLGIAAVHTVYNSGRHVSANGRDLAELLEAFARAWPVPLRQLSLVTHSMGGLVARSALHAGGRAGHAWPRLVRTVVFLGTPHHGAPLERLGSLFQEVLGRSPYAAPFARLGKIRSAGITDLRYGNVREEDGAGRDRFARHGDTRTPLPLPVGIAFAAVAGTTAGEIDGNGWRLAGDGLVPVASALGHHRDPERTLCLAPGRTRIAPRTNHFDLLSRPEVYARVREWIERGP